MQIFCDVFDWWLAIEFFLSGSKNMCLGYTPVNSDENYHQLLGMKLETKVESEVPPSSFNCDFNLRAYKTRKTSVLPLTISRMQDMSSSAWGSPCR